MLPAVYLAQKLAYPLATKDGDTLRTVRDVHDYLFLLPKDRELRQYWQEACRLLLDQVNVPALTRQLQ